MARPSWRFFADGLLTLLVAAGPTCLWSQSAADIPPGATVRVQAPARVVIPGVITMDEVGAGTIAPHEHKDGFVVVQAGDRTLQVPEPGRRFTGRLVSVSAETVTIRGKDDRTIDIPRQAIERLDVLRGGEHRRSGRLIGAVAGFAAGYAIGYNAECSSVCMPYFAGAGLGLLMTIPGMIMGEALAGGEWEPVSTDHVRLGLAPRQAGGSAKVSIRF